METATIRKTTLLMSVLSILPHLFCCGIPAVAAIISLGTTVGLGAALATNPFYNFVDAYHTQLLMIAVAGVVISGVLNYIGYRMDCRAAAGSSCSHDSCTPSKARSFRIFLLSCALLALDLTWFATEEFVLGLHHHDHEHAAETEITHTHNHP